MLKICKKFANGIINLLYPKRCLLCNGLMLYGSTRELCGDCEKNIAGYAPASHIYVPTDFTEIKRVYVAFNYDGDIREALHRLKFTGMRDNAAKMASLMKKANWPPEFIHDIEQADYLIPIPLHKSREKERGFNQSERLAFALSKEYGIPLLNILTRDKKTEFMYGLNRTERFENVRSAFGVLQPEIIKGKNVILVDDIYTTGATIEECARTLIRVNVRSVCGLIFALAAKE